MAPDICCSTICSSTANTSQPDDSCSGTRCISALSSCTTTPPSSWPVPTMAVLLPGSILWLWLSTCSCWALGLANATRMGTTGGSCGCCRVLGTSCVNAGISAVFSSRSAVMASELDTGSNGNCSCGGSSCSCSQHQWCTHAATTETAWQNTQAAADCN